MVESLRSDQAKDIPREDHICTLRDLHAIESEEHFMFRCPIYYAIHGRYQRLFRDSFGPLSQLLAYPNQRCLAAFLHEMTRHRDLCLKGLMA